MTETKARFTPAGLEQRIIQLVTAKFRTFGGGQDSDFNPLVRALKDKPPTFAAGVDVGEVVAFIVRETRKARR